MQQMDDALASVIASGHSRTAVRRYVRHVYYCLEDGTFHPSYNSLRRYVQSGQFCTREEAKRFTDAKLLLKQVWL